MIITVSGKAGSGKSTIATTLAKRLGYEHYSMGDLQRELAKEHNMTIEEWGEFEKTDKKYDIMIDDRMTELGNTKNEFVIDAWLAPKFIPHGFKIWLDVDIEEAIKRRIGHKRVEENFEDPEETKRSIVNRAKINHDRWLEFYNYDYLDMKNYDLAIDTTNLTPNEIIEQILERTS